MRWNFHQVLCIQGLKTLPRTKGASAKQAGTPHTSKSCGYLSILVYLLPRDEHDKGLAPPACSLGEGQHELDANLYLGMAKDSNDNTSIRCRVPVALRDV